MTIANLSRRTFLASTAAVGFGLLPHVTFAAEPAKGGVLKYATLGLDTADPHRHTGSIAVQQIYAEALTSISADGSVEPFLAESFDISPDGKMYTFRLREGVTFPQWRRHDRRRRAGQYRAREDQGCGRLARLGDEARRHRHRARRTHRRPHHARALCAAPQPDVGTVDRVAEVRRLGGHHQDPDLHRTLPLRRMGSRR
jgi:hypothetical protein